MNLSTPVLDVARRPGTPAAILLAATEEHIMTQG